MRGGRHRRGTDVGIHDEEVDAVGSDIENCKAHGFILQSHGPRLIRCPSHKATCPSAQAGSASGTGHRSRNRCRRPPAGPDVGGAGGRVDADAQGTARRRVR
ncbi:hypothetical protein GCM10009637_07330 [Brevibacterium luteolum]